MEKENERKNSHRSKKYYPNRNLDKKRHEFSKSSSSSIGKETVNHLISDDVNESGQNLEEKRSQDCQESLNYEINSSETKSVLIYPQSSSTSIGKVPVNHLNSESGQFYKPCFRPFDFDEQKRVLELKK
ncbi:unnamed protein product [Brachionus calyciflorus]|uniref:Uncharacterized protein n=1 Tax=Brachionus calyciflorus TaxID=104777 RepID=A0A814EUJ7_9BILA|nr:unnamed protein product [Brachionus calyciflorus]